MTEYLFKSDRQNRWAQQKLKQIMDKIQDTESAIYNDIFIVDQHLRNSMKYQKKISAIITNKYFELLKRKYKSHTN